MNTSMIPSHLRHRPIARTTHSLVLAASLLASAAQAAGGHHAIDDAAILNDGQCSLETWGERQTGGGRSLAHVGPSCRVGPVELSLNIDQEMFSGQAHTAVLAPQLKWAANVSDAVSVGLVASTSYSTTPSTRHTANTLLVPLTWRATPTLSAHANWERDFVLAQPNTPRSGVALEWAPLARWSFVAERFVQSDTSNARLGARWAVTPGLNLDISHARTLGASAGGRVRWVTVGVNWEFEQPFKLATAR